MHDCFMWSLVHLGATGHLKSRSWWPTADFSLVQATCFHAQPDMLFECIDGHSGRLLHWTVDKVLSHSKVKAHAAR